MLIPRARYRYLWLTAIVLCVTVLFYLELDYSKCAGLLTLSSSDQKSWIYKGPEAQDKAVILAKLKTEDVSWMSTELPE